MVVGADSLIGAALINDLRLLDVSVIGTSRRKSGAHVFLDLERPIDRSTLPEVNTVFLCAGINGFTACNEDPAAAALVNICATLVIGSHYMKQGAHVVFLSSSAVFGARTDVPEEQTMCSPDTTYGVFKRAAEIALLEVTTAFGGMCSVVRLTKVLSTDNPLLKNWQTLAAAVKTIEAFEDVFVAPISLIFAVNGLIEVASRRIGGVFHFSGEQTISYLDLAFALAQRKLIPSELIRKTKKTPGKSNVTATQCGRLAMGQTTNLLDIQPQPLEDLLASLVQQAGAQTVFSMK